MNTNLSIAERQAMNSYFNTFHMYCENNVIERLRDYKRNWQVSI